MWLAALSLAYCLGAGWGRHSWSAYSAHLLAPHLGLRLDPGRLIG